MPPGDYRRKFQMPDFADSQKQGRYDGAKSQDNCTRRTSTRSPICDKGAEGDGALLLPRAPGSRERCASERNADGRARIGLPYK